METQNRFSGLGLSITGIGRQYPPYSLGSDSLETLSKRFYPESPAYVSRGRNREKSRQVEGCLV